MKMRLSLTAVLLLLTTIIFAQGFFFSSGDFDYEVYGKDSTEVQLMSFDDILKGDIVIPESVSYKGKTYTVTRIEDLGNNPEVVSLRIPKTIKNINSLRSLTNLKDIYVEEGNTVYQSIDGVLVTSSGMSLDEYPRGRTGECAVPEGIVRINTNFHSGITKLSIPSTVTYITSSIGQYIKEFEVTEGNANFSSVNGMLCSKDGNTLIACPAIEASMVIIPTSIDSIGTYAFQQSKSIILNSAIPPSIGHYSWYDYNTSITGIYIKSEYLTTYKSNVEMSKYNLMGYDIMVDSILYAKTDEGEGEVIGSYCQSPSVNIPQTITDETNGTYTITSIGRRAFYQNSALQKVIFPETLRTIGDSAFYNTNLREITLPVTLTKIGKHAFYYCYNINNIYARCAPIDISAGCFYSYYTPTLYVPSEYEELYRDAVGWSDFSIIPNDLIYDDYVLKKLTDETMSIFKYIGTQTDLIIPDEVTADNKTYKITEISESAFYSKGLKSVRLPQYLEVIGENAFIYNSLTSIEFSATLKTIGDNAFYSNEISLLTLPESIDSIGNYAFSSNYSLATIVIEDETPCKLGYSVFYTYNNVKILVKPSSSAEAYKTATNWSNYSSYIYGVDAIVDDLAYLKQDNQTATLICCLKTYIDNEYNKLTIPKNVNIGTVGYPVSCIGERAFYSASYLNELTIPETIDSIGSRAFNSNMILRMESLNPPKTNDNTFYNYPKRVIVSLVALDAYKAAENWKWLGNRIIAYDMLIDGIAYQKTDESHVAVCGVLQKQGNDVLDIPEKVESDGNVYTVSVISSGAFYNMSGTLLTLPQTIDSIASNTNYSNFTYTYLKSTTPPRLQSTNWSSNVVYVPRSSLELYQSNEQWVPYDSYKDYIQGTDGLIYSDSIIYDLNNSTGTAELCLWMKPNTGEIVIPEVVMQDDKPYTVTSIRDNAFSRYYSIKTFRIPANITDIGSNALPSSSGMTVIAEALTPPTIGSHSSYSIQNQSLYVKSVAYEKYASADVWKNFGKIVAFDGGDEQFYYAKVGNGTASLIGPKTVMESEIKIPNTIMIDEESLTVTHIGAKAFMGNRSIRKVLLPNTIEVISDSAFYGSTLNQIMIPANVKNIGKRAFAVNVANDSYSNLNKIQVRAGNEKFMARNENMLLSKDAKTLIQVADYGGGVSSTWGYDTEGHYGRIESNSLDGIEQVAEGAFDGCKTSSIRIPATLITADASMLMYMPSLREIDVDTLHQKLCSVDGVLLSKDTTTLVYFPTYKSRYYSGTKNYEMPEIVRNIAKFAFYNCQFESLTMSDSLKVIADSAFYSTSYYYSSSLQINSLILMNDVIATASETAFNDGIYQNTVLYVPMGTLNDYLTTSPWSNFQNVNSAKLADEDFQLMKAFYAEMGNGQGWYRKWNFGETAEQTRITRGIRMVDDHVYSIDLSNNGLSGPLSDKLFKLPKLEILKLSDNQLACPIDSVLNEDNIDNSVLRELNISDNQLTGNIGAVGKTLKGLTTLNASYNKLSQVTPALPSSIYDLSLYSQSIDTVDYKSLYTANQENVEEGQPNLLFYNHSEQNYRANQTLMLQNINGNSWRMQLKNANGLISATEYSDYYRLYNRPNGDILQLSSSNNYHNAFVRMLFESGDVNFDTEVSVNDLQLTVNYAISETAEQLFNFKAADIQMDDWINVQDVVSLVNILLDQEIETNAVSGVNRRAANAEDAEAQLFWRGNQLVLKSKRDVAALDLAIRNAKDIKWLLNDVDYDFTINKNANFVRVIHYSMSGKEIKAGETIIAEAVGSDMNVLKADIVDKDGFNIKTYFIGNATGIEEVPEFNSDMTISADVAGLNIQNGKAMPKTQWAIYNIGGKLLGKGISNLSAGTNYLKCNLSAEKQIVVRLSNNDVNITKKLSITK